ncbi:MAG: DinB family protein [Gemmatimonadaceae bacterium]
MTANGLRDEARGEVARLSGNASRLLARIEGTAAADQRYWHPEPDAWSLTEIVQHLALVNSGMLRTARPTKWQAGWWGAAKSATMTRFLRSSIKIKAPVAAIVPRPGVTWDQARGNLVASISKWTDFVDGDSFESTFFHHPLVGRLTAAHTAKFVADHFDHHMRQVDRLFAALPKES